MYSVIAVNSPRPATELLKQLLGEFRVRLADLDREEGLPAMGEYLGRLREGGGPVTPSSERSGPAAFVHGAGRVESS
jgi:hypothetical protein